MSGIHTLRIERHDPHQVVAVAMEGHTKAGRRWTAIEELREEKIRYPRREIFMVLFQRQTGDDDHQSKQLWVYPTSSGEPNFGEASEWMTPEEKEWCREENARILDTVREYPEWEVYLR